MRSFRGGGCSRGRSFSREDVERDNRYRTVATKLNSFQVEVQRGRIDGEVDKIIKKRKKGSYRVHDNDIGLGGYNRHGDSDNEKF